MMPKKVKLVSNWQFCGARSSYAVPWTNIKFSGGGIKLDLREPGEVCEGVHLGFEAANIKHRFISVKILRSQSYTKVVLI